MTTLAAWATRRPANAGRAVGRGHRIDRPNGGQRIAARRVCVTVSLAGNLQALLDGKEYAVRKGSLVHIPPGVVHGAKGKMRVLVTGIPDIADDDLFFPKDES